MKNRTYHILKILLLSIIVLALVGILIFLLIGDKSHNFKWNFQKEQTIIYEHTYSNTTVDQIKIEVQSSDVTIKKSATDEIRIVIYGEKGENATSQFENNQLEISKEEKNQLCFGFCFVNNNEIVVYVPEQIETTFQLKSSSGDIRIEDFQNSQFHLQTSSGDIEVENAKAVFAKSQSGDMEISSTEQASISTSSGSIEINRINGSVMLETSSGDIEIEHFQILQNSSIHTSSGDVSIENMSNAYIQTKTNSGDIHVKESNRFSEIELQIETKSGDISVR